jgi:hypothetical protein
MQGTKSGAGVDTAMAEAPRRFPAPWRADKMPGGYVVRDATGQAIVSGSLATLPPAKDCLQ